MCLFSYRSNYLLQNKHKSLFLQKIVLNFTFMLICCIGNKYLPTIKGLKIANFSMLYTL